MPYEHLCQIRRLLGHWKGLGTEGQRLEPEVLRSLPALDVFLAQNESLPGDSLTAPDWVLESLNSGSAPRFADLNLEQLHELKELIRGLSHAGRLNDQALADKERRRISEMGKACSSSMNKLNERSFISERAGLLQTLDGALRKGLSGITSMRFIARWMDGCKEPGENLKTWFTPLQNARSQYLVLLRQMDERLREPVRALLARGKIGEAFAIEDVALPEDVRRQWNGLWDMEKVYAVALNMGNAGNLKALLHSYGWSMEDLGKITSKLSAEEWQAIQQIWDAIDTLYEPLDKVHRKLRGFPLPKVKAQAFDASCADGTRVRLKGGYYPLIFDRRLSEKAAEQQSVDDLLNGMEAVLRQPSPKSGMTKERKGGTLPPKLSFSVLDRHVQDTALYITHALPLHDAMRLFRDPDFKAARVRAAGEENYNQLLPWLRGIARPNGEQEQGLMKAMDWLAKRGTMFAMGLNMKSALLQLTSIGISWSEVGTANFMRAAATILASPRQTWATIRSKSAFMQNRAQLMDESINRECRKMRANGVAGVRFHNIRFALDSLQKAQFALITAFDSAVAMPTWLAAYDSAIARGVAEADAISEADGAVAAAQGGGGPLDAPAVLRQAGLARILCPFMSFALSDFNRKLETVRGLKNWVGSRGEYGVNPAQAFMDFGFQWVMPVVLSCLIVGLGQDDEWPDAEDYFWEALTFYSMGVPIVRDVTRMAQSQFGEKGYSAGRTPLAYAGVDNLLRGAKHTWKAWDSGDPDAEYRAMKEMINATGFALGLGTPQIWRMLEGSEAYFVDDQGGVLAPLLGKPKK